VMLMFVVVFVVGAAVAEADFAGEAGLGQNLQGAIDGSLADGRVFFLDEAIEVLVGEVFLGAQEDIENEVALAGALETFPLDVFQEDFLLFAQWLRSAHQWSDFSIRGEQVKECGFEP